MSAQQGRNLNRMGNYMATLFFSYERPGRSALHNHVLRGAVEHALDKMGIYYQQCEGVFEGVKESSYLVKPKTQGHYRGILALAKRLDQDCVLHVSAYGGAKLVPVCKGDAVVELGKLVTSKDKPKGDYTYNPRADEFYSVQ